MFYNGRHMLLCCVSIVKVRLDPRFNASFDRVLTLSRAALIYDKRAQAKVARARARVCRGMATPLVYCALYIVLGTALLLY